MTTPEDNIQNVETQKKALRHEVTDFLLSYYSPKATSYKDIALPDPNEALQDPQVYRSKIDSIQGYLDSYLKQAKRKIREFAVYEIHYQQIIRDLLEANTTLINPDAKTRLYDFFEQLEDHFKS